MAWRGKMATVKLFFLILTILFFASALEIRCESAVGDDRSELKSWLTDYSSPTPQKLINRSKECVGYNTPAFSSSTYQMASFPTLRARGWLRGQKLGHIC
jgi:hypothetical protein